MPLCGRKFNGSGCIGSRWGSFLDLSHVRVIRHTETREPKHTPTLRRVFKFVCQIYSMIKTEGSNRGRGGVVGSVYLPGTSGTGGSYFSSLFFPLSSPCLFTSFIYKVCTSPMPSCARYLSFRLPVLRIPTVAWRNPEAGAPGWQIWCKVVEESFLKRVKPTLGSCKPKRVCVRSCGGARVCACIYVWELALCVGGSAEGWVRWQ